jgi:CRISPR/Cas system-associated exonuclease Cas4 (RecB family)
MPGDNGAEVFDAFIGRLMADLRDNFLDRQLMSNEKRKADTRFLYSAFVGEDNFDVTTPLGRLIGDALASRMQKAGFQVIEVRLSRSMRIHKKFGMLAMSQDIQKLFTEHQATFMITGSYTVTPEYVYVLAKVIGNTSQVIYASSGIWLPRSPMVNYLLNYREPTVKVVPAD